MGINNNLRELVGYIIPRVGILGATLFLGYHLSTTDGTVIAERIFQHAGNEHYELEIENHLGRKQVVQFHGKNSHVYKLEYDISQGDEVIIFSLPIFPPDRYGIKHFSTRSVLRHE